MIPTPPDPAMTHATEQSQDLPATTDEAAPEASPADTRPADTSSTEDVTDEAGTRDDADALAAPDEHRSAVDDADADDADADDADDEAIDWEQVAADDDRTRAALLESLAAAEAERDERLDQLRRKQAEFDNYRKRMVRDARAQRVAGKEAMALALLDVLDDFERTIAALQADDGSRKGVELVRDKLVAALASQGLERIEADGAAFDPNLHEAVQQVPGEAHEPTVAEVLRTGWKMHDRVLRAAMVVVAQ